MSISKGYKLVPEVATMEMKNAGWRECDRQGIEPESIEMQTIWTAMHLEAPTPPQPIYDEAKERALFEAFYGERAKTLPLPLGNPIRYGGGQYVNDFALFGWMVWLECAQSRAKAGEDE